MTKPPTLNELKHLETSGFGQLYPRHGLKLLYWFANDCLYFDGYNRMCWQYDPEEGDFGFRPFENRNDEYGETLLPDVDLEYYEVGNLRRPRADELPDYVLEDYNQNRDHSYSNMDRIMVSVDDECFDRVYVTEHSDRIDFDKDATYCISRGLIMIIRQLTLEDFLWKTGYSTLRNDTDQGTEYSKLRNDADQGTGYSKLRNDADQGTGYSTLRNDTDQGTEYSTLRNDADQGTGYSTLRNDTDQGTGYSTLRNDTDQGTGYSTLRNDTDQGTGYSTLRNDADQGTGYSTLRNDADQGTGYSTLRNDTDQGTGYSTQGRGTDQGTGYSIEGNDTDLNTGYVRLVEDSKSENQCRCIIL